MGPRVVVPTRTKVTLAMNEAVLRPEWFALTGLASRWLWLESDCSDRARDDVSEEVRRVHRAMRSKD